METMALGDETGVFVLHREFAAPLANSLRWHLQRMGVEGISGDDLDGLVIDACLELYAAAPGWNCRGALPWVWAEPRLRAVATRFVGQHCDQLDEGQLDQVEGIAPQPPSQLTAPEVDDDPLLTLGRLAADDALCRLLADAMNEVGSSRDQTILLEVRLQALSGDPSPAVTVATQLGMRPEAVRQAAHRLRSRLQARIENEPKFRPLAGLALLSREPVSARGQAAARRSAR